MIKLEKLKRLYPSGAGVWDVSISVPGGAIYVLCGANGAGKTTALSVLSGLLFARTGTLEFAPVGQAPRPVRLDRYDPRTGFGYVGDRLVVDPALTGWQWVAFAAHVKSTEVTEGEAAEWASRLDLQTEQLDSPISSLSFGNRRRVAIWAEMATTRDFLVLDEPFIGLDPLSIRAFHDAARAFVAGGRSILLSTHLLAEAESVATHVGFLHEGRVVEEGPLDAIRGTDRLHDAFVRAAGR